MDLWRYLSQPLVQQGHREQGAQAHIQAALEDLQGNSTASGQPVPMLCQPHSTAVLLLFMERQLGATLCPLPLCALCAAARRF